MMVKSETGAIKSVDIIASNEDHVGNLIAEGVIAESDRHRVLAQLYKGQYKAKCRDYARLMARMAELEASA